ncbi:MAG: hypothetical protein AMXMBFR64_39490 [Myxococcales bacterium]
MMYSEMETRQRIDEIETLMAFAGWAGMTADRVIDYLVTRRTMGTYSLMGLREFMEAQDLDMDGPEDEYGALEMILAAVLRRVAEQRGVIGWTWDGGK